MQREAGQEPVLAEPPPAHTLLQGGDPGHRYRGCLLELLVRWLQRQDLHRHRDKFGKAAVSVLRRLASTSSPGLTRGHAAADRLHLPDKLDTEDLLFGPHRLRVARENRACRAGKTGPRH